jgi:hypothetical protein
VRGATNLRGTPVAAHVSVGGNYVHPFPRVLQWSPLRGEGVLVGTATVTTQGPHELVRHDETKSGDFYLAKTGDPDLATSGDFLMATDSRAGLASPKLAA